MATVKISKHQRNVLIKAFRMLRAGCLEGERLAVQAENDPVAAEKLVVHSVEMMKLAAQIEQGLMQHAGAAAVIEQISKKRGKPTETKPSLRVVKGGAT